MKLNTISRLEQFLTDALLSSELIPLGVNVIRLAATTDEEGITSLSKSIVVRYVNSSCSLVQKVPLVTERTMTFEIIHSAQSYLTESGHDSSTQMCSAAYMTLNNSVPTGTGIQVEMPFRMISESFSGITDSSHYVYTQTWEIVVQEIHKIFALDPCVLAGNCSSLFPSENISSILPGDVVEVNKLFSPILPPPDGEDYDPELCGVEERGDDLVFVHDPSVIFLSQWQDYQLFSTGTFTGDLLNCNIRLKETGEGVGQYFASNCDDRMLISIGGTVNIQDQYADTTLKGKLQGPYTMGWASTGLTKIYVDPTDQESSVVIKYGTVFEVDLTMHLVVGNVKYYKIHSHRYGGMWISEYDVVFINRGSTRPDLDCEFDTVSPPLESCE